MLLEDFYTVQSIEQKDGQNYDVWILVNEKHAVFKGHFPGNPIMPGVCMMQIIKEVTEQLTNCKLLMQSVSNVKFMALINPDVTPKLRLELSIVPAEDNLIKVKTLLF